ncbi:MAG: hypothetical protein KDE27_25330, partial [Planctomycetes bacterium]|nr:hypothetical protein [Planctomycetota bacterium]
RADAAARAALCTGTRPCGEPPAGVEAEPAIIRRQVEPGASPSADLERAPAVPAIGPDWKVEEQLSIFFAQPRTDDRPDEARCEGDAWDETVRRMSRCGKARACRASKTGTFQFFVGYFVDIAAPGPAYPPELHGRRPRCRGTLRFTPDGGSARDVASWNERGSYRGPGRSILEKELSFESKSSGELAVELVVEHSSPDYTVTYDDVLRCEIVDCA